MDGLRQFLEVVRAGGVAKGNLRGLLVTAVGGKIARDGVPLSGGSTWRELAELLKRLRWDKNQVAELGIDPKDLPPRDRAKFWYQAMVRADLGSADSLRHAEALKPKLEAIGFTVSLPHGP